MLERIVWFLRRKLNIQQYSRHIDQHSGLQSEMLTYAVGDVDADCPGRRWMRNRLGNLGQE